MNPFFLEGHTEQLEAQNPVPLRGVYGIVASSVMNDWKPVTDSEFDELFKVQYAELSEAQRNAFDQFRVPFWKATVRRSETYGDETVFVVAQKEDSVIYFDDVENGLNISIVDSMRRILDPGGSQDTLKELVENKFPKEIYQ